MNKKSTAYILKIKILLVLVLVLTSVLSMLFVNTKEAYAEKGLNTLCIPKNTGTGGDHWKPDSWLKIDIVSRFLLKISYTPNGNCTQPADLDSKYIRTDQTEFAPFVDQTIKLNLDRKLLSLVLLEMTGPGGIETLHYEMPAATADQSKDETRIDRLDWGAVPGAGLVTPDSIWNSFKKIDAGGIDKFFAKAEYTLGFEENLLKDVECDGDDNLHLGNKNSDSKGVIWFCDGDGGEGTGAYVSDVLTNKQNFNIVFIISPDGKKIIPAFPEAYTATDSNKFLTQFTFSYCNNKYINDGCNGDYSISGMTPDQALAVAAGTKDLTIKSSEGKSTDVVAGGPTNSAVPESQALIPESAGSTETEPSCETSGFSLSWLTCGIINGLNGVVQGIFTGFIEPYLVTSPVNTEASPENPIFKVWSAMRSIANIILIFGLLFVVFGQAVGGGMIDAYTAKKIMPRILIAAILINISIYLVAALIDIFNILGAGIGNLFLAPFKDTIFTKFDGSSSGGNTLAVGAILAAAIVAILSYISISAFKDAEATTGQALRFSVAPFMHFILVFVLIPAVLITLAIFATLIIRQGLILILIVTAPIAFALFALPATEKYFTKWRETFVSTLMVYPIITVLFAVSIIMASISYNVGDSSNATFSSVMGAIVSFIILFVPLALIPFAFKMAGGLIGNILNTSRGLGSKLSASPQNKYKENKAYERKLLYDQKAADQGSSLNRRLAAKGQGRKIGADKRRAWIGGAKNAVSPQDEVAAFGEAYAGAAARGVDANGANEAGGAARGSYRGHKLRLTDASGNLSPTNLLAARAGGAVAGAATAHGGYTPQQVTSASNSAVSAYQTSVTAGYSHNESTAAAIAAGDATLANRSQQAVSTSGRVAAEAYRAQAAAPSSLGLTDEQKHATASTAANAVGQTAANVYDESLRRSGGNAAKAATDATDASRASLHMFEQNRSTHSTDAAATAALAAGDAFLGTKKTGVDRTPSIEAAANAAAYAHDNAVSGGVTDPAQARAAGRQAGQAHW